jgi:hypothetical protein
MLSTVVAHPCIWSCLSSSECTLFLKFWGRGFVSLSSTIAALEDTYTGAALLETIRQIHVDELDGAGTHEVIHHIREGTPTNRPLFPSSFASLSCSLLGISGSSWNGSSSTLFDVPCPAPPGVAFLLDLQDQVVLDSQSSHVLRWIQSCRSRASLRSSVRFVYRQAVHAFVLYFVCCHGFRRHGRRLH